MDVIKPLLSGKLLMSATAAEVLQSALGRPLDLLYSRIGGFNGRFFPAGWGNLGIVNLQEDIERIKDWPPEDIKIHWKLIRHGNWNGAPYKLFEGSFRTPCIPRIFDALPPESRSGRVQLLIPAGGLSASSAASTAGVAPLFDDQHTSAAVVHLAATGDHSFSRRIRLAAPLLKQGVCHIVHESPYYGGRRPIEQKGSKLCAVSDLLALGWATIYESLCLLHWLEHEGVEQRGICGLSMGGVHAAMTAGLYPKPLAITPLLAPRSAAVAYCDGALAPLMHWQALVTDRDWADNQVEQVVAAAAQQVSLLAESKYVDWQQLSNQLQVMQDTLSALKRHQRQQQQTQGSSQRHWQKQCSPHMQTSHMQEHVAEAVAAVQTAAAVAAATQAAEVEAKAEQDLLSHQQQQQAHTHAQLRQHVAGSRSGRNTNSSNLHVSVSGGAVSTTSCQVDDSSWKREVRRRQAAAAAAAGAAVLPGLASTAPHPNTFRRLRHVLETYTDVTRYPRPVRPDAAVLVAARDDGYVDMASVKAMQAHWPGSELRLVSGGHVSAFLLHQNTFRTAICDSLKRLARRPAQTAQPIR